MALLRPQPVQPRVVEIGRLFKGSPKRKNQKGQEIFGEDLNYFRFMPNERLQSFPAITPNFESLYHELSRRYTELGEKPRTLRIRFAYPTPEDNFSCANEVWKSVKGLDRCVRRCDGATVTLHITERSTLSKELNPCAATPEQNKCPADCVPTGRLKFFLPDLNYPGIIVLSTHSVHDIQEIRGNLEAYASWDLTKLPFRLCRTEKTITRTDEQGNVFPLKKWLCHIEIDPEFGLLLQRATEVRYRAELSGRTELALPPAVTIDAAAESVPNDAVSPTTTDEATKPKPNPNRDLLKRIGQMTGHSSKRIAEIIVAKFPGYKSDQLNDLELRIIVDLMCVEAATLSGMDAEKALAEFSQWQAKQHPEIGNFELAKQWMAQLAVLSF